MDDAYLVHRDTLLSVVERYVIFNDYISREELAALLGIALPNRPPAQPDPELEELKQVLAPDYTPTPPLTYEQRKAISPNAHTHDDLCIDRYPDCLCHTCQNDTSSPACCSKPPHRKGCYGERCPDYVPEVSHDPLS